MIDTDILEDIKDLISKQFHIPQEEIEEDSYLDQDLGIVDLELEDLVSNIQNKYDIQIPQENLESFKKVSDIVFYVYESIDKPI